MPLKIYSLHSGSFVLEKKKLKNRNGQALLSPGVAYFQGPMLAAHKGRIKDKMRKLTPLLERRKKRC